MRRQRLSREVNQPVRARFVGRGSKGGLVSEAGAVGGGLRGGGSLGAPPCLVGGPDPPPPRGGP